MTASAHAPRSAIASIPLRPRSAPELVDAAFQILRAHYPQFVMCSALGYLPWLIVQLAMAGEPGALERVGVWAGAFGAVGIWLIFALMSAVVIVCTSQIYLGESLDVAAAVRRTVPRMPWVLIGALARYALMFAGLFAFLIGALYAGARFFAVTPVLVLEDSNVSRAFTRSTALSNGRKRHVLNTLGLVAGIYWILGLGVQFLAYWLGNEVTVAVLTAVYSISVYPIVGITEALLYFDSRIKSEGLDIELMLGALDAPASAPTDHLVARA